MYWFNPTYYLFALPALILGLYAQYKVRSAYAKYQKVPNQSHLTGYEVAQRLLYRYGMGDVKVRETRGVLSDHYDPRKKTLSLSLGVARSTSVASLGIVAHEVGHALQDHEAYAPLKVRAAIVPAVQLGSWLGPILFMLGLILRLEAVPLIGVLLFSTTFVFALITLPVELDASKRAVRLLVGGGLINSAEETGVRSVLQAAALTYVAAAVQALSTIMYYVFLLGGFRRRD